MNFQEIKSKVEKSWKWIWNSDSPWSWIIALILIFIFVKYIFFPTLSLVMGTALPLAGVESSSMDHSPTKNCVNYNGQGFCILLSDYDLCGKNFEKKEYVSFNQYWETCGKWYETRAISKETFSGFPIKNGFKKGDIIITWGRFTPKVGDIIIFQPNPDSLAPRPIIHRIIKINEDGTFQTKGDHNAEQLIASNNVYRTDETSIHKEQIIGKAILRVPYLGWFKIWFTDLINAFMK